MCSLAKHTGDYGNRMSPCCIIHGLNTLPKSTQFIILDTPADMD